MEDSKVYIMNEVCIPGLESNNIKDLSCKEVCTKCGNLKDKCTCK